MILLSVPPSSLGLSGLWLHLPVLPSQFSPCMGGFTRLGHGCVLYLALPSSQGCIPILTIKWHLCIVFTAPGHPESFYACSVKDSFVVWCLCSQGPWLPVTGQSLLATVSCWIFTVLYSPIDGFAIVNERNGGVFLVRPNKVDQYLIQCTTERSGNLSFEFSGFWIKSLLTFLDK